MVRFESTDAFVKNGQVFIDNPALRSLLPTSYQLELNGDVRILSLLSTEQLGMKELKRELKPVHRALYGIRAKLRDFSPDLKISLIRSLGYALTSSSEQEL